MNRQPDVCALQLDVRTKLKAIESDARAALAARGSKGPKRVSHATFSITGLQKRQKANVDAIGKAGEGVIAFQRTLSTGFDGLSSESASAACVYQQLRARLAALSLIPHELIQAGELTSITIAEPKHRAARNKLRNFSPTRCRALIDRLFAKLKERWPNAKIFGVIEVSMADYEGEWFFEPHVHAVVAGVPRSAIKLDLPKGGKSFGIKHLGGYLLYLTKFKAQKRKYYQDTQGKSRRRRNSMTEADRTQWLLWHSRLEMKDLVILRGFSRELVSEFVAKNFDDLLQEFLQFPLKLGRALPHSPFRCLRSETAPKVRNFVASSIELGGKRGKGGKGKRREVPLNLAPVGDDVRVQRVVRASMTGELYFLYGTVTRAAWFSLAEVQSQNAAVVYERLALKGIRIVTERSRRSFRQEIETAPVTDEGLVAAQPGWVADGIYARGDGIVVGCPEDLKVVVTFAQDSRFSPQGSREVWRRELGRIVGDCSFAAFLLSYALVGPLLKFAPGQTPNPMIELTGARETGKSSFGIMAQSVFAGGTDGHVGGGTTWNMTSISFDTRRAQFNDALMFVDEMNEMDANLATSGQLPFKQASTTGRGRYKEPTSPPVHMALLTTSNKSSILSARASASIKEAAASRNMVLSIDEPMISDPPRGFEQTGEAIDKLVEVCTHNYAHAGERYIRKLVKIEPDKLRANVARLCAEIAGEISQLNVSSARERHLLSLIYAAGQLGKKWKILPAFRVSIRTAVLEAATHLMRPSTQSKIGVGYFTKMLERQRERVLPLDANGVSPTQATGNWFAYQIKGSTPPRFYVPVQQFKDVFGNDYLEMIRELRRLGALQMEGGKTPKMSIKAPKKLGINGRVYSITLGDNFPSHE